MHIRSLSFLVLCLVITACQTENNEEAQRIGHITAFSEVVGAGVKKLALSEPMSSAEMDHFFPKAEAAAKQYGVSVFREDNLLVSDLFPAFLS